MKPIIKCAGGKSKLAPELVSRFPKDFSVYVEPFLGGASVYLYFYQKLLSENKFCSCYLNDNNSDIINLYIQIQKNLDVFFEKLNSLCIGYEHTRESFLQIRDEFNKEFLVGSIERATRFLYLNKTCFNGLTRYNSKGYFNTSYGKYKNRKIYELGDLVSFRETIRSVDFGWIDFSAYINYVLTNNKEKEIFIYLDPPYIPLSKTASFTQYSPKNFQSFEHVRLENCLANLPSNCKFMLSNSDTPETRQIFRNYRIEEIWASRRISCKGDKRNAVKELIICNY